MRASRYVYLGALAVVVGVYVAMRPFLAAAWPYLAIAEFPAALVLIPLLLWPAIRRRRPADPREREEWRRHEQRIRALPDPEAARFRSALAAWRDSGARADEAADALARGRARDDADRERLRSQYLSQMADARSPRKRTQLLDELARETQNGA